MHKLIFTSTRTIGIDKNTVGFNIWQPIAPEGYIALGYIVDLIPNINPSDESTQKQPSLNLIYCVDKSCFNNLKSTGQQTKFEEITIENTNKIWSNSVPDSNIGKDLNNEDTNIENNEKEIINFGRDTNFNLLQIDIIYDIQINPEVICKTHTKDINKKCYEHTLDDCNKFSKCVFMNGKCTEKTNTKIDPITYNGKEYSIMKVYE